MYSDGIRRQLKDISNIAHKPHKNLKPSQNINWTIELRFRPQIVDLVTSTQRIQHAWRKKQTRIPYANANYFYSYNSKLLAQILFAVFTHRGQEQCYQNSEIFAQSRLYASTCPSSSRNSFFNFVDGHIDARSPWFRLWHPGENVQESEWCDTKLLFNAFTISLLN